MSFFAQFQKEIISLGFALTLALILYFFRARAKLVWGTPYGFTFLVHDTPTPKTVADEDTGTPAAVPAPVPTAVSPASNIQTASIIIENAGRESATGVEVTFNWKPQIYNIWPSRPYDTHLNDDKRFTLKFDNLAPREAFQIELISPGNLPALLNVRCKECAAKFIRMRPMKVYPNWVLAGAVLLMFLGVASIFYAIMQLSAFF